MRPPIVIDTNVLMVASGRAQQAGPDCVLACAGFLEGVIENGQVVIDDGMRILDEYRRNHSLSGQPTLGDAFLKWLWSNQANGPCCRQVSITPRGDRGDFEEFPRDPMLENFDLTDRKFVAVALASGVDPPINNASDTDWWEFRDALARHRVTINFLCQELMTTAG